jgi:FtsZ-binding cell division protein ZapB
VIYTPSKIENQHVQIIKQLQYEAESLRQENANLKNERERLRTTTPSVK